MFEPWVFKVLACVGLLIFAYALSQSPVFALRRLSVWLVLAALGLALWFISESWIMTVLGLACWFLIPMGQAFYFSRNLKYSIARALVKERLEFEEIEDWTEINQEFRKEGFVLFGEYTLKPSPVDYGFRLFQRTNSEANQVAAIGLVRQGVMSLTYLLIVTKDTDGVLWVTWDFPLSYGLKMPPQIQIYRCMEAETFSELLIQHHAFLKLNEVTETTLSPEPSSLIDQLFGETMRYNLEIGLLRACEQSKGDIYYSWRGTFFILGQVLRQMVKG